eukprot:8649437-Pyramimonas_sp.AAC.1
MRPALEQTTQSPCILEGKTPPPKSTAERKPESDAVSGRRGMQCRCRDQRLEAGQCACRFVLQHPFRQDLAQYRKGFK